MDWDLIFIRLFSFFLKIIMIHGLDVSTTGITSGTAN